MYEGVFTGNSITGSGMYKWTNGDSFEGTFLDGKMHGKGIYRWPDGGEYIGEYLNNLKDGYGVFKWANGKVYEGDFQEGKPHGNGVMKLVDGNYQVTFSEGKLIKNVKVNATKDKFSINPHSSLSSTTMRKSSPSTSKNDSNRSAIYRK